MYVVGSDLWVLIFSPFKYVVGDNFSFEILVLAIFNLYENMCSESEYSLLVKRQNQNQNQNSLLVKRQNDNTSPGDWQRKISP